jgi:hypothetical protein
VFNKENEINYIGQGVGYTQGIGINYEVDFDTFKELINKIFKKQTIEVAKTPDTEADDSDLYPDYINMKGADEKEKKNNDQQKQNQEAIPTED